MKSWDKKLGVSEIAHGEFRLVLMQGHITGNMLNFLPDDISKVLPNLKAAFPDGKVMGEGKAFDIYDPDGNEVYLCEDH